MSNYSKQWSTATPGYLIFLIDQSSSMIRDWRDGKTYALYTAEIINRTISELIATNAAGESVKNRVFISLISYSGHKIEDIRSDYLNAYAEAPLRIDKKIKKVPDGEGGFLEMEVQSPVFIEPLGQGTTPMSGAFKFAKKLIDSWVELKNDCPVPVIINVSDGMPDGGNKEKTEIEIIDTINAANDIMNIETNDGSPLIFNVHIASGKTEIQFPESTSDLGNDSISEFLFKISSRVPDAYLKAAKDMDLKDVKSNSKGFISNASPETLIKFINFGSSGGINRATI